jgi:hypothetical protein
MHMHSSAGRKKRHKQWQGRDKLDRRHGGDRSRRLRRAFFFFDSPCGTGLASSLIWWANFHVSFPELLQSSINGSDLSRPFHHLGCAAATAKLLTNSSLDRYYSLLAEKAEARHRQKSDEDEQQRGRVAAGGPPPRAMDGGGGPASRQLHRRARRGPVERACPKRRYYIV